MAQKFNWCNVNWVCEMEGGRIIHPDNPYFYYDQSMIYIDDNYISLNIQDKPKVVKYWDGTIYYPQYGCGLMRSVDEFGYGYFTSEIKLPHGKNLWPSFWLVGVGHWPDNGEIDICEAYCDKNGSYFKPILPQWKTTQNVHYEDNGHKQWHEHRVSWFKQCKNPSDNFLKYQCEWRPNKIIFRINDKIVNECNLDVAKYLVGKKMKVVFNLFPSNDNYTLTDEMIIKYFDYQPL